MNNQDNLRDTVQAIHDAAKTQGVDRVKRMKAVYSSRADRRNAWREQARLDRSNNPSLAGLAATGRQLPPWRCLR